MSKFLPLTSSKEDEDCLKTESTVEMFDAFTYKPNIKQI